MNPQPLALLNHFTVPLIICPLSICIASIFEPSQTATTRVRATELARPSAPTQQHHRANIRRCDAHSVSTERTATERYAPPCSATPTSRAKENEPKPPEGPPSVLRSRRGSSGFAEIDAVP